MNAIAVMAVKLLLGVLGDFLVAGIKALSDKRTTDRLGKIAVAHVHALARYDTLTNDEKRDKAIELVKRDAAQLGIEAKDWIVRTAVELAVGAVKAGF